jgi:hypothetical protein
VEQSLDLATEEKLMEQARANTFTAAEIVSYYDNVRQRGGTERVLGAIENRMRKDFAPAATRKFGTKDLEATDILAKILARIDAAFDLSGNELGNHIKTGGDQMTKPYNIYRYVSFRNGAKLGAQLALIKDSEEGELQAMVRFYKAYAREDNFSEQKSYPLGEIAAAESAYTTHLDTLGVPRK